MTKAEVLPFEVATTMRLAFIKAGYKVGRKRTGLRTNRKGWFIKRRK